MMQNLRVRGEGRFQIRRGAITGLSNRNVWQLTMSRYFDRLSRFKRQSCKAHERASLPCSRRDDRSPTVCDLHARQHVVVTAIGSLVPITSMKASSLSFSIAPRPAFIEVETTVWPARARGRPRMRAVPHSDLCVSSRRSRGYKKNKRAFTGPLGSTQHRELRPAHRKRPKPPRNQTRVEWNVIAKARQK